MKKQEQAIEHNTPNYFSILPAPVRYDEEISMSEKVFFSEITALSNKWGFCTAPNSYFAKLYGKSPETISRWVSKLAKRGHVEVQLEKQAGNVRRIYPVTTIHSAPELTPIDKNVNTPIDKNVNTPIDKNVNHNNTSKNSTRENKEISFPSEPEREGEKAPSKHQKAEGNVPLADYCPKMISELKRRGVAHLAPQVKQIIDDFKEVTGKSRTTYFASAALKVIIFWLSEGFTREDFRLVFEHCTWKYRRDRQETNVSIVTMCRMLSKEGSRTFTDHLSEAEPAPVDNYELPPKLAPKYEHHLQHVKEYWPSAYWGKKYLTKEEFHQLKKQGIADRQAIAGAYAAANRKPQFAPRVYDALSYLRGKASSVAPYHANGMSAVRR